MTYSEYTPFQQNPQFGGGNAQSWDLGNVIGAALGQGGMGMGHRLGQAAFGQQGFGGMGGWQGYGWGNPWQRQLGQQDIGEIVRNLVPLLPQIVSQAQPQAAFGYGYGGSGGLGGMGQRHLSQQDVQEVVRQVLPVIPQIMSLLQGQQQGPFASAIHGGLGWGQPGQGGQQFGQFGYGPLGQAAFGTAGGWGGRQLGQAEVGEIVRQLAVALPQVIANLQAYNQQRAA
jgi:hypothetical protein